jgi:uncharacterized protein (TIGR02118 family)
MHKALVLYLPPEDPQAFREHYESTHIPLTSKIPGIRAYRYSFDVSAAEGESPYFCIFEGEWDDAQAMDEALSTPEGQAALADIPNYATGGAVFLSYPVQEASGLSR